MSAKTSVNPDLRNLPTVGFLGHKAAASFISLCIPGGFPRGTPDHIPPAVGSEAQTTLGSNPTGSGQGKSHPWLVEGEMTDSSPLPHRL